jgi:hypothetical protein
MDKRAEEKHEIFSKPLPEILNEIEAAATRCWKAGAGLGLPTGLSCVPWIMKIGTAIDTSSASKLTSPSITLRGGFLPVIVERKTLVARS